MTVSAIGYVAAALILIAGVAVSRHRDGCGRTWVLAAAALVAAVVGWLAWLLGTSA